MSSSLPRGAPTPTKIELIDRLSDTGLQTIEATSFYDTAKLKSTLESLVDFDRINARRRVSALVR